METKRPLEVLLANSVYFNPIKDEATLTNNPDTFSNRKSPSDDYSILVSVLIAATFWLLAAGLNLVQVAASLLVVILLGQLGLSVLQVLTKSTGSEGIVSSWTAQLGPAVGIGLMILFLLRSVTNRNIFLSLLAITLITAAMTLVRTLTKTGSWKSLRGSSVSVRSWLWQIPMSIALLGLILRADWWWTMPVSLSSLIAAGLIYLSRPRETYFRLATLAGSVLISVGYLISTNLRADLWWISYNNDDDPWFHLISHGLIEWGPFTRPDVASNQGASAAAYHLLAYFLTGLLDLVWPSEPMFVLSRVLPVVTAVIAIFSLHFFLSVFANRTESSAQNSQSRFWLVGAFCAAVVISGVPSDFLGAGLLIGFIALAPTICAQKSVLRYSLLVLIATATIAFSKGPYMYAITLMLIFAAVTSERRLLGIAASLISSALVYVFFSQNSMTSAIQIGFFASESLGEHAAGGGYPARGLAVMYVIAPVALGFISSLALNVQPHTSRELRVLSLGLTAVVVAAILSRLFIHADPRGHIYLFQPGVIASGLLVILCVEPHTGRRFVRAGLLIGFGFIITLLWYRAVPVLVPSLNSGSVVAKFLRMVRDASIVNLAFLIVLLLVSSRRVFRAEGQNLGLPNSSTALPKIAVTLLVATSLPSTLTRFEQRYEETRSGEEDVWRTGVIGSADAREVSLELKRENLRDELVAYTMCGNDLKQGCVPPLVFAAYSEARFLSVISDPPEYWNFANESVRLDYEFSSNLLDMTPSDAIRGLQQRNVSLLVLDTRRAGEDWNFDKLGDLATVLFHNDSFALLRLPNAPHSLG